MFCLFGVIVEKSSLFQQKGLGRDTYSLYEDNGAQQEFKGELNEQKQEKLVDERLIKSKSVVGRVFLSFSLSRNLRKLIFTRGEANSPLRVLHGVRTLSIAYMILGHAYFFAVIHPQQFVGQSARIVRSWWLTVIGGGFFAVDVFFFLSGFLCTYPLLEKVFAKGGKMNVPLLIFHRYFRLIFPIAAVTLFSVSLMKFTAEGPLWNQFAQNGADKCKKYWWTNLLFIQNIYPWRLLDECVGWTWYLAIDMQLFLVTPFVV